ncbi:TonB-dependent receptor [Colwellia chukchiensis]|uniref:TonB-dependent receptor n=1 Tax=Colwellia chukchiensis TaxID=641665 RepID=A0A1H7JQX9_9GAMM|nr:TonB-dependent receptor [Colwellia chukchiensis]SEK76922.1 TonB-dependent receptor [Colwellia chukchiensis]
MQIKKPKLSYLSMLVMLNLGVATTASAAEGSQSANKDIEVITVSGIHASMVKSMDIKKSSDGVVDAIVAEDIGKFPDQNVAESLQRISGVAIDRDGGEGQLVSVRGLGPEFNAVLVNGRTMSTVSGGRAFSFDTLASELISGAEVHKTQSAKLQDGSIGATINITTHRPLSIGEFKAVASVKNTYDKLSDSNNPTFSGLISNTFDDGKFGVLASLAYSDKDSRSDVAQTAGYLSETLDSLNSGETLENVFMPRNYDQIVKTENRERTSGSLVLQYRANDDLLFTADALYSKYDVSYREDILAHWFEPGNIVDATLDENRTIVQLATGNNSATDYLNRLSYRPTTTKALGVNMDWQLSDELNVTADVSYSNAKSDGGNGTTDTVAGFFNSYTFDTTKGGDVPELGFEENLSKDILGANWASIFGDDIEDKIVEARLDAEWIVDQGSLSKVNFGTSHSSRTLSTMPTNTDRTVRNGWGGYVVQLPSSLFTDFDADGFLSAAGGDPVSQWLIFDSYEFMNFLESDQGYTQLDPDSAARMKAAMDNNGGHTAQNVLSDSYEVKEELTALYVDAYFEGELSAMPWQVVAGVRYVKTDTTSSGYGNELVDITGPDALGKYVPITSDNLTRISEKADYSNVLPSINANIEVVEDVIIRAAWSKSITRPTLTELSPATSYSEGKIDSLSASGGNPNLEPYESDNFDLSLEWYFDDASYAAISYYTKDVDNFIDGGISQESVTVPNGEFDIRVSRPMNLNSTKIDGVELALQHRFTYLPAPFDGLGVMANMTFVDSESSADTAENPLPLPGLGDSQNAVLFYEKDAVQFRIAYNNRDEFMQVTSNWAGGAPIYVEDYYQVDVSGSYDITDDFTVFFEGINVTNEVTKKRGLYSSHALYTIETGPRYSIGVRGTF